MQLKDKVLQAGINTYKHIAMNYTLPPLFVKVETTKVCNLKCPNCRRNYAESISSEPGDKHLTEAKLWRITAGLPIQVVRFEGDGEPTCNPHFKELVKWCYERGMASAMTTNATLLDAGYVSFLEQNGMRRIHVSFDGAKRETFENMRYPAKYDQVLDACRYIGKSAIQLFMNVLLSSDEVVEQLHDYAALAQSVGATGIHYMKLQADSLEFGTPPNLERYKNAIEEFRAEARKRNLIVTGTCADQPTFVECDDAFTCPYVLLNDDVYGCTYMANLRKAEVYCGEEFTVPCRTYRMGNLNDASMRDIWNNGNYSHLRQVLKATRRTNGTQIKQESLLQMKRKSYKDFGYCVSCLCRWGESGI